MGRLTLVLGGARSGKSRHAQELALQMAQGAPVVYVATGQAGDDEMQARIALHRQSRPAHWRTAEVPLEVGDFLRHGQGDAPVVLIDCLTLFVTNHLLQTGSALHNHAPDSTEQAPMTETWDALPAECAVADLIEAAQGAEADVVLVSNEVGLGLVPETPLGRLFRDVAGRANQQAAAAAGRVVLLVAGLPLTVKE